MGSLPEEGGLKEEIYADNNIIISYSAISNILPPQIKKMSAWYKVVYGCESFIMYQIVHSSLLSWYDSYLKNSKVKATTRKT